MARKLTKKQEKILTDYMEQFPEINTSLLLYDDLPKQVTKALETLNDYESLWSDTNRFIYDYQCISQHGV